jgi:hypothetical protein
MLLWTGLKKNGTPDSALEPSRSVVKTAQQICCEDSATDLLWTTTTSQHQQHQQHQQQHLEHIMGTCAPGCCSTSHAQHSYITVTCARLRQASFTTDRRFSSWNLASTCNLFKSGRHLRFAYQLCLSVDGGAPKRNPLLLEAHHIAIPDCLGHTKSWFIDTMPELRRIAIPCQFWTNVADTSACTLQSLPANNNITWPGNLAKTVPKH